MEGLLSYLGPKKNIKIHFLLEKKPLKNYVAKILRIKLHSVSSAFPFPPTRACDRCLTYSCTAVFLHPIPPSILKWDVSLFLWPLLPIILILTKHLFFSHCMFRFLAEYFWHHYTSTGSHIWIESWWRRATPIYELVVLSWSTPFIDLPNVPAEKNCLPSLSKLSVC